MTDPKPLDFATIIANSLHDIKNELAIVVNTVDELATEHDQSAAHDPRFDLIRAEGQRLNSNFVQLLALYRIENQQFFLSIDNHNLYECLEEIALENQALLQYHQLQIELDCDTNLDGYFDRNLIQGVVNSTLNNAFRYAQKKITLQAEQVGKELAIRIIDDGPGYPEDVLNQQKQHAIDFKNKQTGLGLYFAQTVAELHHNGERHGRLELSNHTTTGGGVFSLYLP